MRRHDEPVLVTTASPGPAAERHSRERRYLITMGIRVVAFIIAIVVTKGWVRVIAVALALVLPWIAVIAANAPKRGRSGVPSLYIREPQPTLTDGRPDEPPDGPPDDQ